MTCVHLQQLYQLCQQNDLKLSSSDLIHIVCKQCNKEEVCPSTLAEEYDSKHVAAKNGPSDQAHWEDESAEALQ